MRSLFLILFFIQVLACKSQEWAPIGSKWYFNGFENGIGSQNNDTTFFDHYFYESIDDTIINSKLCKIIRNSYYNGSINNFPNEYMYSDSGRVYYYRYGKFNLLYDFNAVAGDTISIVDPVYSIWNPDTISRIVIDSVKWMIDVGAPNPTISYGLDSLKVYYTHPVYIDDGVNIIEEGLSYHLPVIENIGSTYMFFPQGMFVIPDVGKIRCYEDSSKYFKWYTPPCDKWIVTNINSPTYNNSTGLFPNPFNLTATIKIDTSLFLNNIELSVYTILGEIVHFETFIKNNEIKINRNNLSNGMYFYQLSDNGKIKMNGKFIIE